MRKRKGTACEMSYKDNITNVNFKRQFQNKTELNKEIDNIETFLNLMHGAFTRIENKNIIKFTLNSNNNKYAEIVIK